jgi:hypothetical protein
MTAQNHSDKQNGSGGGHKTILAMVNLFMKNVSRQRDFRRKFYVPFLWLLDIVTLSWNAEKLQKTLYEGTFFLSHNRAGCCCVCEMFAKKIKFSSRSLARTFIQQPPKEGFTSTLALARTVCVCVHKAQKLKIKTFSLFVVCKLKCKSLCTRTNTHTFELLPSSC